MRQITFFDELTEIVNHGFARATDPDTSKQSAKSIKTNELEHIVYQTIKQFPDGCIMEEVENILYMYRQNSLTPRIAPLIRKGYVMDTGLRKPSSSGRNQRILKAIK